MVSKYKSLNKEGDQSQTPGSSTGKRVFLPSTYIGGRSFMDQLYYDGMVICSKVKFPDLFITFTCNPNWPEIQKLLKPLNMKAQDRPDVISMVFKIKFNQLLSDLIKMGVLSSYFSPLLYNFIYITKSYLFIYSKFIDMYTIEFQKRGLPHVDILIFFHPSNKYPKPEDIDKIISAEVPDPNKDPKL